MLRELALLYGSVPSTSIVLAAEIGVALALLSFRRNSIDHVPYLTTERIRPLGAPRIAQFLLRLLAQEENREVIERDLEEQFEQDVERPEVGLNRARMRYRSRLIKNIFWSLWDCYPKRLLHIAGLIQRK